MNPNSMNQWWSKWVLEVYPQHMRANFNDVKLNMARFARKAFGTASNMRIFQFLDHYHIEILTEGHPVTDSDYVEWMRTQWLTFLRNGLGEGTKASVRTKLMAGSLQDGSPAEQLVILPSIPSHLPYQRVG